MRIIKGVFVIYLFMILHLYGCTPVLEIGSTRESKIDNMTMVYVPEGEFKMGSEFGLADERPVHTVFLNAFWIDQTEITNAMYRKCVQAESCQEPNSTGTWRDQESTDYFAKQDYDEHPVVFVSWNDARNYCTWTERRLPTEAEWEKAASWDPILNEQRVYPWGNIYDCSKGNFDDETELDASLMANTTTNCDGFVRSSSVGSFPEGASAYGALDMGGNVWEWVNDAFIEVDPINPSMQNYYAISPEKNPQGVDPSITEYRGMRGGSWNFTFGFGRAAYRLWYGLDDSYDGVGFRCASDASQ